MARVAHRVARLAVRAGWLGVRVVAVAGVVRVALAVVGAWPTAAGLAVASLVWGLRQWQRLEGWLDARERRRLAVEAYLVKYLAKPPHPDGRAVQGHEHAEFARALVAVSARYLAHCEDQADKHVPSGEGLR